MNDNEVLKEQEIAKLRKQYDDKLYHHEVNFICLPKEHDELHDHHEEFNDLRKFKDKFSKVEEAEELSKDLLRKEINDLTEVKNKSLEEETILKKQLEDLKSENVGLKA